MSMERTIVYVDSLKKNHQRFKSILSCYFDLKIFSDPNECSEELKLHKYPLILSTSQLRAMSGSSFFKLIEPYTPHSVKILICKNSQDKLKISENYPIIFHSELKKNGAKIIKNFIDQFFIKNNGVIRWQDRADFPVIIGSSESLLVQIEQARKICRYTENVLITGETGTGKDLFARYIHLLSKRKNGPYHLVNCASIHPSLFESEFFGHLKGSFTGALDNNQGHFFKANNGTLVLDEISEIDIYSQAKLLRAIENQEIYPVGSQKIRKIDTRIITITNKNLSELVKGGTFRRDLYHRLNFLTLHLPPLRNRLDDLKTLAEFFKNNFLRKYSQEVDVSFGNDFFETIKERYFYGNIRELESIVYKFLALRNAKQYENSIEEILEVDKQSVIIPQNEISSLSLKKKISKLQTQHIVDSLKVNRYNVSRTASQLGMSRQNLQYLIKKLNLKDQGKFDDS